MPNLHHSTHFLNTFQKDIDEALELIEISHQLFLRRLSAIEAQSLLEENPRKKDVFRKKALKLFSEYKNSLQVIEKFIEQAYEKNKSR